MKNKILIVEDEAQVARLTKFKLVKEGYEVTLAENGIKALESIKNNTPDIIILDIMMPEMDGFTLLQNIKEDDNLKNIPVIMLTVKGAKSDINKAYELGAEDYIVKPFHPAELAARIKKILGALTI